MSSWGLLVRFVQQNLYNLSRPEFARLRRHQDAAQPAEAQKCVEHIERAELTTYEGIAWINPFLDLIYVMVIFKIDDVLLKCSPQRDRAHDPQAAANVYIVAVSFFVQMFFTRYQMDAFSSSFVELSPRAAYPLLQSDLFHRAMVVAYGFGIFVLTTNMNLAELPEHTAASAAYDVGSCKFVPAYAVGFAAGFLLTRGVMCLLYAALLLCAADPLLHRRYRSTFLFRIGRNVVAMVCVAPLLGARHSDDAEATNRLCVVLLAFVALVEVSGEFLLVTTNRFMRRWLRLEPSSSFFIEDVAFDLQPARRHRHRSAHSGGDTGTGTANGTGANGSGAHDAGCGVFCDAALLQERLSLFFMLILGESFLGLLYLAYDPGHEAALLVQGLVYFLVVSTGTLFFETVDRAVDQHDHHHDHDNDAGHSDAGHSHSDGGAHSHGAAVAARAMAPSPSPSPSSSRSVDGREAQWSSASSLSPLAALAPSPASQRWRAQQTAQQSARRRRRGRHGLLARYPWSHVFVWAHVAVAFTLLLATAGIVGLYSDATLVVPAAPPPKHRDANATAAPTATPTPSQSLSQWQMAAGLALTALGCVAMRLLHHDYAPERRQRERRREQREQLRRSVALRATLAASAGDDEAGGGREDSVATAPPTLWDAAWAAGRAVAVFYFLELATLAAAAAHVLVYVAFHDVQPADDATLLLFGWHTLVNVALSLLYLLQRVSIAADLADPADASDAAVATHATRATPVAIGDAYDADDGDSGGGGAGGGGGGGVVNPLAKGERLSALRQRQSPPPPPPPSRVSPPTVDAEGTEMTAR
eukprot:gene8324-6004_t